MESLKILYSIGIPEWMRLSISVSEEFTAGVLLSCLLGMLSLFLFIRSIWVAKKTGQELQAQYRELAQKEKALKESELRYCSAVEGSNDGIWELDLLTWMLYPSPQTCHLVGMPFINGPIPLQYWVQRIHPDDQQTVTTALQDHLSGASPTFQCEYRILQRDGEILWINCRGKVVQDTDGRAVKMAGSASNITERKNAESRVYRLAYYDILTGLPNRTFFCDTLLDMLKCCDGKSKKGAVLFMDLDNFKTVNDALGHNMGDIILTQIATACRDSVDSTYFMARLGGDEFALLIPCWRDRGELAVIAQSLLNAMQRPFVIQDMEFYITGSIGITAFPEDGNDVDMLYKNADIAMFMAKEIGRNNFQFYSSEMNQRILFRLDMDKSLRYAIKKNEFYLCYQPQVDMLSGRMVGLEALIRWHHPIKGCIAPGEFIPYAEESGLILPIGDWVIRTACRQIRMWKDAGYGEIPVAVNISARQLQNENLITTIREVLEEYQLPPACLELEITETIVMQDFDQAIALLRELKMMGLKISLDDFGTGYSSLNYLKHIPIDTLKIDKVFVDDLMRNTAQDAIVQMIIALAHKLDLQVVAEGVENRDQIVFLRTHLCDRAQGYFFGKPLEAEEIQGWFKHKWDEKLA